MDVVSVIGITGQRFALSIFIISPLGGASSPGLLASVSWLTPLPTDGVGDADAVVDAVIGSPPLCVERMQGYQMNIVQGDNSGR